LSHNSCTSCATYHRQLNDGGPWRKRTLHPLNVLMFLIGCGLIVHYEYGHTHIASIPWETLTLITFLGVVLSFTRVWQYMPRSLPVWSYVPIAGIASAFMDSFLVLVIVVSIQLRGSEQDLFLFRVYVMLAALIGGALTYFGEVWALPIALMSGLTHPHSVVQ